jgi:hypothetical protein
VAAIQGVLLVIAAAGLVPFSGYLVGFALVTLVWSFGRDTAWLFRHRVVRTSLVVPGFVYA